MNSNINKIIILAAVIMALFVLSLGIVIPAIVSTKIMTFWLIVIAGSAYAALVAIIVGALSKKLTLLILAYYDDNQEERK